MTLSPHMVADPLLYPGLEGSSSTSIGLYCKANVYCPIINPTANRILCHGSWQLLFKQISLYKVFIFHVCLCVRVCRDAYACRHMSLGTSHLFFFEVGFLILPSAFWFSWAGWPETHHLFPHCCECKPTPLCPACSFHMESASHFSRSSSPYISKRVLIFIRMETIKRERKGGKEGKGTEPKGGKKWEGGA